MDKVEKLELAIVNVVADLLEAKTNVASMLSTQKQTLGMLQDLLKVLEENKILDMDAVEQLQDKLSESNPFAETNKDFLLEQEIERIKKVQH